MRSLILQLEEAIQKHPDHIPGHEFKTTHHFQKDIYLRELFIPKDTIIIGKIHRFPHLNLLTQGKITVWTEEGMKTLTASTVIKSSPGIKRVGYSHEDTVWITVHDNPMGYTKNEDLEAYLSVESFDQGYLESSRSFEDFSNFSGFSRKEIELLSEDPQDQIAFSIHPTTIRIAPSQIHGYGVFAMTDIAKDMLIAPARVMGKRTPVGRFCNHSGTPNARFELGTDGNLYLISNESIKSGSEILNDYYLTMINRRSELPCL